MIRLRDEDIMCAVCKRQVERVERREDCCRMTVHFRVFCHGQVEESELERFDFARADRIIGTAFATPRLDSVSDSHNALTDEPAQLPGT